MILAESIEALCSQVTAWRSRGERIALVPTMGNLHEGHLALVERARREADRTLASIFLNPLQFDAGEDFEGYPHTPEEDAKQLREAGVDLLFTPPVNEVYPRPRTEQTRVDVQGLSGILCGASRPGHFVGVATVVCKLFNMVLPDVALFGTKDYQQLIVIRRMVEDLCMPIEIIGVPTVREKDGLARSSRNGYLTPEERTRAPALYRALQGAASAIHAGSTDYAGIERQAGRTLEQAGFRPDYFCVRRACDLAAPAAEDRELVILGAASLGKARLIDNLAVVSRKSEDLFQ